jgi:hypothetical protein
MVAAAAEPLASDGALGTMAEGAEGVRVKPWSPLPTRSHLLGSHGVPPIFNWILLLFKRRAILEGKSPGLPAHRPAFIPFLLGGLKVLSCLGLEHFLISLYVLRLFLP